MMWRSKPKAFRLSVKDIPEGEIALCCRVRLARNLRGHVFPDRATAEQRTAVRDAVMRVVETEAPDYARCLLEEVSEDSREFVFESRVISKELMERDAGAGLVMSQDASVAAMINEEDHLRIQGFAPCMDIETAWRKADAFDSALDAKLRYAWSPRWGYLTACPSNLGTGMRVSVMLHLIGLRMTGDIEAAVRGLERMRLLVRGTYGEGSESSGQIYQVSNMDTLGMDEQTLLTRIRRICEELIRQERNARARIIANSPLAVYDVLTRAVCLLQRALLVQSGEAMELLSTLRFGVSVGLVKGLSVEQLDGLMLTIQPAHLQREAATSLTPEQRDAYRAVLLNAQLAKASLRKAKG